MTDFKIEKYDIGGNGAIAGDGQLTGSEVKKAQKDGWTVWDGYSANNPQPENTKAKKQESKKEYINFDEFDKGGKNAIAGDGKLTGDEVARANVAGYKHIYEGVTAEYLQENSFSALRDTRDITGSIGRAASNSTTNKFVRGLACTADLLLLPLEMAADFTKVMTGKRED